MVLKGKKCSKRVKKWSQHVQYCHKWSSMFPNSPKWSKQFTIHSIGWPLYPGLTCLLYGLKYSKFLLKNHPNGSDITRSPGLVFKYSDIFEEDKICVSIYLLLE